MTNSKNSTLRFFSVTITDAVAAFDSGNDHITIRTTSPLTVSTDNPVVNNDGGNITLATEGTMDTDDLTINASVTTGKVLIFWIQQLLASTPVYNSTWQFI